jgi:hypothetical protein
MMNADIADVVGLAALGLGDPEQGVAILPADSAGVFRLDLEAEKPEQAGIKRLRFLEVAHPDR